jgi:hypothetical protein
MTRRVSPVGTSALTSVNNLRASPEVGELAGEREEEPAAGERDLGGGLDGEGHELGGGSEPEHPEDAAQRILNEESRRRREEHRAREAETERKYRQERREKNGGVSPPAWEDYLGDESEEQARASIPQFPHLPSPPPAVDDEEDEALGANRLILPGAPVAGHK